jgi:hypothetical protein
VPSILLAFAIDAWWDYTKDLIAEEEMFEWLEVTERYRPFVDAS